MDGGVGGAGEEAVRVEKRAQAAECDADHDRRGDAGPARQRRPGPAGAHQGRLSPAGHLPRRGLCSARRAAGTRSSVPFSFPRGESLGAGERVSVTVTLDVLSSCFRVGRPGLAGRKN